MKIFVSDSEPIISFARAGHLDLLHQVINELWIPEAVYREIIGKGKGRPGTGAVLYEKWIKKRKITDKTRLNLFSSELGLGERGVKSDGRRPFGGTIPGVMGRVHS